MKEFRRVNVRVTRAIEMATNSKGEKMKKITLFILIFIAWNFIYSKKIGSFPQLVDPQGILIQDSNLIVWEKASISIYSLMNYKLLNKFGRMGEGPEEFKLNPAVGYTSIVLNITPENIFAHSAGKLSIYNIKGVYQKEIKIPLTISRLKKLGDGFVCWNNTFENKTYYQLIELFDAKVKKN